MSHFNVAVFTKTNDYLELKKLLAPYEEIFESVGEHKKSQCPYVEFVKDEDYLEENPETGEHGHWRNPKAKWDFWSIGGRWRGFLKLLPSATTGEYGEYKDWTKEGKPDKPGYCDFAKVRDCDFSMKMDVYERALRFWDIYVDEKPCSEEEYKRIVPSFTYSVEYFKEQFKNRENFAKQEAEFGTYAMITEDGIWMQTGQMGWWGADNAGYKSRNAFRKALSNYIQEAREKDLWITIVDCHI